jgi:hypothetical protein
MSGTSGDGLLRRAEWLLFAILFVFLVVERSRATRLGPRLAGLFCGLAVLSNYSAALAVVILCAYALLVVRPWIRLSGLLIGGALPASVLLGYHWIYFGNPFALANTYQSRMFNEPGAIVLGVLGVPDPSIAGQLLFSVYRGLFFSSPVLALSSYGLARMARRPDRRAEALLIGTVFDAMLLMNASFNGWHGGWCFGPRYLVPAVPFLALPLALAWPRWPGVTAIAASVSGTILLGVTSITVMIPQGFSSPYRNFLLPLAAGRDVDTPIYRYLGPVSVNPAGIVPSGGPENWASFNLGEFLWPRSWLSLVPLLAVVAVAVVALARTIRHGKRA